MISREGISYRMLEPFFVSTRSQVEPDKTVWVRLNRHAMKEWHHMTPEQRQAIKDAPPDAPWPFQSPLPCPA